jgi:hypothetical protein
MKRAGLVYSREVQSSAYVGYVSLSPVSRMSITKQLVTGLFMTQTHSRGSVAALAMPSMWSRRHYGAVLASCSRARTARANAVLSIHARPSNVFPRTASPLRSARRHHFRCFPSLTPTCRLASISSAAIHVQARSWCQTICAVVQRHTHRVAAQQACVRIKRRQCGAGQ